MARGHNVTLACRNGERCAAAKRALDARRLAGSCACGQLDLADYESVRAFAADWREQQQQQQRGGQLVTLVNNAGVMGVPASASGTDGHLAPNVFGPFLLTRLLLPLMAADARVVNVGSEAHYRGVLGIGGVAAAGGSGGAAALRLTQQPGWWYAQYARSKLANGVFTAELARRLEQRSSSVTTFCASPGRVNTSIFANVPGVLRAPLQALAAAFFQTPAQGARTVLQAALSPELGVAQSGSYLHAHAVQAAAPAVEDPALGAALWQLCAQECGLSAAEDAALWPPH